MPLVTKNKEVARSQFEHYIFLSSIHPHTQGQIKRKTDLVVQTYHLVSRASRHEYMQFNKLYSLELFVLVSRDGHMTLYHNVEAKESIPTRKQGDRNKKTTKETETGNSPSLIHCF